MIVTPPISHRELKALFEGYGYETLLCGRFRSRPESMHADDRPAIAQRMDWSRRSRWS